MPRSAKSRAILRERWAQFMRCCEYKQAWSGGTTRKADRWFPSSKTCSECGSLNHNLTLSAREWICLDCGSWHDRDENAVKNVLNQTTVRHGGTLAPHAHLPRWAVPGSAGESRLSDIRHHVEGRKVSSFSAGSVTGIRKPDYASYTESIGVTGTSIWHY